MKKHLCLYSIIFLSVGIMGFFSVKKSISKPVIIGFSAQLTGSQAELGVQERNGVQLAVEKVNAEGGIEGRKISLIIHDDLGSAKEAESGDKELIKKGAAAIIGHATTALTLAGLKATNPEHEVMIAPTVSTPELSGLDDYFFRVYPSFKDSSENFAQYVRKYNNITHIAIIYDRDNLSYSRTYSAVFSHGFQSSGGSITYENSFSSSERPDFSQLLSEVRESDAEGLLIVASDIDTAFIAQRARIMGLQIPMFASDWAQTETLINNGGKAVEGMKLVQAYSLASTSQNFIDFESHYRSRFGKDPSFGAVFSYEATLVLCQALKSTGGNKDGLKDALLGIHNFKGLMNTFSFDKYGDVERPWYLSTIYNGNFVVVNQLASSASPREE